MPFLVEFFTIFYPNIAAREEKRRQLYEKLLDDGSDDAEKALDYLSEVGDATERAVAKFNMARICARRRATEQAANYVLEAAPLAGDGVSRAISRTVARAPSTTDYLSEIEEMVSAWEMYRSGRLEEFAHRLTKMGKGLTPLTFSETRLAFLRDTLESVDDSEKRIEQRLQIGKVLMDLARWKECEEQQRRALAEAEALANLGLRALVLNNLAYLLEHTNRLGEAESLMLRALEIVEIAHGERHSHMVPFLGNLASLLHDTSRVKEAESLMLRALEVAEVAFGERRPDAVPFLGHLASLLHKSNCNKEAEPLFHGALEIDEAAFGPQHPIVAVRSNNLGKLLHETNRLEEAEPLMRKSLDIFDSCYRQTGYAHPDVQRVSRNYQALRGDMGSE